MGARVLGQREEKLRFSLLGAGGAGVGDAGISQALGPLRLSPTIQRGAGKNV